MRKSFALFMVLVVFAIGGTCLVNATLLEEKDNVQITETVVYGDKSVVEGVTIERNIKYNQFMHWNTTYVVGEEPSCETVYTFDEYGRLQDETDYNHTGIELYTDVVSAFDDANEDAEKLTGVDRAMKELFDKTEPGQESSRIIDLADYLEFYEYDVFIDLPGDIMYSHINKEDINEAIGRYTANETYVVQLKEELRIVEAIEAFFKIPVIENHLYEITVAKDADGHLYGWGYGSANGGGSSGNVSMGNTLTESDAFSLWTISTYTNDACYFTFNPYTDDGKLVDTSYIPGGFGIYCLPFDKEKRTVDVEGLRMVYAIDPTANILNLHYDEQRNQLLLFFEREEECTMTVIDASTLKMKQEIVYSTTGYDAHDCYIGDDFMVLLYEWCKGVVFSVDETGTYQMEITLDMADWMDNEGVPYLEFVEMAFDWDGETLIMSGSIRDEEYHYYQSCDFYLAAFDRAGMVYYGEYETNQDTDEMGDYYTYNCRPTDAEPIKISW
ncbi:MAG: hypothetical protein IJZ23_05220 [Roseburia sp.]|nr:hypothetical protein [Roseburia sp.]